MRICPNCNMAMDIMNIINTTYVQFIMEYICNKCGMTWDIHNGFIEKNWSVKIK